MKFHSLNIKCFMTLNLQKNLGWCKTLPPSKILYNIINTFEWNLYRNNHQLWDGNNLKREILVNLWNHNILYPIEYLNIEYLISPNISKYFSQTTLLLKHINYLYFLQCLMFGPLLLSMLDVLSFWWKSSMKVLQSSFPLQHIHVTV